ncbi:hypothetical protein ACIPIN_07270 [Pseudomonas sp. NPDC087697]
MIQLMIADDHAIFRMAASSANGAICAPPAAKSLKPCLEMSSSERCHVQS